MTRMVDALRLISRSRFPGVILRLRSVSDGRGVGRRDERARKPQRPSALGARHAGALGRHHFMLTAPPVAPIATMGCVGARQIEGETRLPSRETPSAAI